MPSVVKKMAVTSLTADLKDVEGLVLVGLEGLDMPENEGFRTALAEHGVRLQIVPNKIAQRVLGDVGFEFPEDVFKGTVGVVAGDAEQTIGAAKAVVDSPLKSSGKLKLVAGALEGNILGASDAAALADVPDRPTLQAKLLGCLAGPAQQLVGILNAPQGALARVVQARVDAGDESEG